MPREISFDIKLNQEQKEIKNIVYSTPINFIIGKEGTGKTMLAINIALDLFFRKDTVYNQIIITRPIVSTEDFGYLPGGIEEKINPYLQPIYENINKLYGNTDSKKNKIKKHFEKNEIRILPIAFTRGVTYDNAIVVIDEFQNCTISQVEMIIGRLGKRSKLIFSGSKQQVDLKKKSDSFINKINRLKSNQYCYVSELIKNHRHPAVEDVLNIIRKNE